MTATRPPRGYLSRMSVASRPLPPALHRLTAALRGPLAAALLVAGCAPREPAPADGAPPAPPEALATPAPDGSRTPWLTGTADGTGAWLSWQEVTADSTLAVRLARWSPAGWDTVRTVTAGRPLFMNWADFPAVTALPTGELAAHWLEREAGGRYTYGIRVVRSGDGGATWSAPVTPHTDGLAAEHGFVSLWPAGGDTLGLAWLDGRKTAMPDSAREMTVRAAHLTADGALSAEALLDARSCDCCQTAAARTTRGMVVVYRDRAPGEIRDIAIVRQEGGRWSAPALVHADDWHYAGCPVNGPAVAAHGDTVVVAWFTAAHDTARVLLARSTDGGATFGAPVRIDGGTPLGRVALALDADHHPLVAWLEETSADAAEVRLVRVVGNTPGEPRVVTRTSGGRPSGFPRMVRVGEALLLAWTDVTPTSRVRMARVSLSPSLP